MDQRHFSGLPPRFTCYREGSMPLTTLFGVSLFISRFVLGAIFIGLFMRARLVELEAARKLAEVSLASAQSGSGKLA